MSKHYYVISIRILALCVIGISASNANDLNPSKPTPLSGNLNMPLVSPDDAAKYLEQRVVPKNDELIISSKSSRQPLVKLNAQAKLGHKLPTNNKTPYGFIRADFAVADQQVLTENIRQDKAALGPQTIIKKQEDVPVKIDEKLPVKVDSR
ncbi:MAG: hypothetical protein WC951_13295 [Bacteroidales bacterium]|nr:hypothetical protein [Advenella sp.]